ncbi:MAG: putative sulfate/molybdate transporter [Candidatus Neomarinimicrobiota bacterium]|nr:putative sulfate/molybdate transporter [Candidatus Neomarinimicrobiota bacterium]
MYNYFKDIKFDRNEWSGAFGDIGTDFPLIVGMILAAGLDSASVLVTFGVMQIFTGSFYKMPMPIQPLKAMATIVITQKISPNILYGGGLAIGISMLLLNITKLIDWISRVVPKAVIRGIQLGLGIKLGLLALQDYVIADGVAGYYLAAAAFLLAIFLLGNRKYPPAIFIIVLGMFYAFVFKVDAHSFINAVGIHLPQIHTPTWADILTGFLILTIPQIPLSIGNSILATNQIANDWYPKRTVTIRKISYTYSLINLINPFFSGIPTCHGSGGIVGHHTFGGRTGGSVIIYGCLYIFLGLFLSQGFDTLVHIFPLPILGILLLFESLGLMLLVQDVTDSKSSFMIALLVGLISGGIQYGFVIGLFVGTLIYYATAKGLTGLNNDNNN